MIREIISRIGRNKVAISADIPMSYLLKFCANKITELFWGILKFRRLRAVYVSKSAKIECPSKIKFGRNFRIGRYSYINALSKCGIQVGDNVSFGMYTTITCTGTLFGTLGKGLVIGNNVGLGTHGFWGCAGGIEIGDDTIMGNFVSAHSENHNFQSIEIPIREQGVTRKGIKIGKGCWIGTKCTILDGAYIGDGVVVAAGSVVRGEIPPFCVIAGVPAKIIKYRNVQ